MDIINYFDGMLNFQDLKARIEVYSMEDYEPEEEEDYLVCSLPGSDDENNQMDIESSSDSDIGPE
jgi:hypothetical protein